MAKTPKPAKVIPKTIGACADALYSTRQTRLVEQKDIAEYKDYETALKNHIIAELPKSDQTGVAGKLARVTVKSSVIPVVEDWEAFYKHVKKTGHFDLLQKRVSAEAVQERWDSGKKVPGVGTFTVVDVSVNKV